MSASDANSARRLFVNILRNSAQSYKASAEVTSHYADMIESGNISPKVVEDLLTKYPGLTSTTPSDVVGSSKQKNKNKNKDPQEDMKVIMFKPPVQGDDGSKKRKRPSKKLKDPNAPKRPPNAFFLYQKSIFSETRNENPEMSYKEVQQEISKMWTELGAEGKKPYQGAAEMAKVDYEKLKGEYEAGLAAAALEGDLLGNEDSDGGVSAKSAFVKAKSSSTSGKASTSKMVDKTKGSKMHVARLAPAPAPASTSASTDAEESVDEIDSDSDEEEEEEPPKKKVKKHMSSSPSRAKKDDKENMKLRK